MDGAVSDTTKV